MASEELLDEEPGIASEKKSNKKKKPKKEKKKKNEIASAEEEKDGIGGKIVLVFVTLLILLIWLAIIAVLIKADIGGFGSTVMYPIFKDVPYVNKILPDVSSGDPEENEKYTFDSIEEAVDYIKDLDKQLQAAKSQHEADSKDISDLEAQVKELKKYKEEQEAFEKLKTDFYNDVLYYTSDEYVLYNEDTLKVLEAYRKYFEEIEPAKAEGLYKQVITQLENAEDYDDYVNKYANMPPKKAAAIFNEAESAEDMQLVADILNHMKVQNAADILAQMDAGIAFKLTYLLKPELR